MITGVVTANREAVLRVRVRGTNGYEAPVDALLDTGFNGFLTLPSSLITHLGLPFVGPTRVTLGDGSEVPVDVFEATVLWDNHERPVVVLAVEGGILVGMALLAGHRVTLDVEDGGSVLIEVLS